MSRTHGVKKVFEEQIEILRAKFTMAQIQMDYLQWFVIGDTAGELLDFDQFNMTQIKI